MTSPDSPFSTLLSRHAHALHTTVTELVKDFYFTLDQDSIAAEILAQLGTDERLHLHATQAEHLRLLLHPELDRDTHRQAALRGGRAHAIIGVSASSLVRAMGLYLQTISPAILRLAAPLEERSALLHVIGQRLQQNLQWQIESLDHFQAELDDTEQRVTTICQAGQPWADTIRSILDAVLCIPGITGSAFLRHDRQGHLVAEFFAGSYEAFWQKIHSADGAAAKRAMEIRFEKAWQTAIPEAIPNFVSQKHAELRAVAMAVKVRSATILPLCPKSDKTVALLCLTGNYPFTFNSSAVTRFLTVTMIYAGVGNGPHIWQASSVRRPTKRNCVKLCGICTAEGGQRRRSGRCSYSGGNPPPRRPPGPGWTPPLSGQGPWILGIRLFRVQSRNAAQAIMPY
jgi:hypothetical protein